MIGSTRYIATAEIARQSQLSAELTKLQQSVSTNKRMSAASDDPSAAARVAAIRADQADNAIYTINANSGVSIASAADTTLGSVATAVARAKEIMLQGRTDSATASDRAALATELRGIVADLATYATASDTNGRPLFPTSAALAIPVSAALSYTATDTKAAVFDTVTTASGTKSLSAILSDAATALDAGNGTNMTASIAELDAGVAHVASVRTDQGIRAQRFADVKERLSSEASDMTVERSSIEDTDLTYALSEIQSKQLALQAAQTVFAQSHKSGLFDMLS